MRDRVGGNLAASLDHFICSVRAGVAPEMTLDQARHAQAMVDAAKRSAAEKRSGRDHPSPRLSRDASQWGKPRIGVASLFQETNTFSPKPTGWEDFTVLVGEEAVEALAGTNTEFAGVMAELKRAGRRANSSGLGLFSPLGSGDGGDVPAPRPGCSTPLWSKPVGSTGWCWPCTGRWPRSRSSMPTRR